MTNVPAMKGRLAQLELRRGSLMKTKEDLDREIKEIDRDARILVEAIEKVEPSAKPKKTAEPDKSGEKVK